LSAGSFSSSRAKRTSSARQLDVLALSGVVASLRRRRFWFQREGELQVGLSVAQVVHDRIKRIASGYLSLRGIAAPTNPREAA
jgi:hypothetical protein